MTLENLVVCTLHLCQGTATTETPSVEVLGPSRIGPTKASLWPGNG
jgi:hypothetical protein